MSRHPYRYVAFFLNRAGQVLDRRPLKPDWHRAIEWVRWQGMRRGQLGSEELGGSPWIEPLWEKPQGEPFVKGFRLGLSGSDGCRLEEQFPLSYFREAVEEQSQKLADRPSIEAGESRLFKVAAYFSESAAETEATHGFQIQEVAARLPIEPKRLAQYLECSQSPAQNEDGDIPVFVPLPVVEEVRSRTEGCPDRETGGILIGHLCRDLDRHDLFLVVTAQIPVRYATASATQLKLTARTWEAVAAALDLRARDEIHLGWWHSHPVRTWCADCPAQKRKQCPLTQGFFSADDRILHRSVFPRAYSVALVSTYTDEAVRMDMFGWDRGMIRPRRFRLLDRRPDPSREEGGDKNAQESGH